MGSTISVTDLAALPALPKKHLSWPFQTASNLWDPANLPLLAQYVRIAGSVPLSVEWYTSQMLAAIGNLTAPVCVTTSPFQQCAANKRPASYSGADFINDIGNLSNHLSGLSSLAPRITEIAIDTELWYPPNDSFSDINAKYAIVSQIAAHWLPAAKQIFYNRGAIQPNGGDPSGWAPAPWYNAASPGNINSCSLDLSEWAANQYIYIRTQAAALAGKSGGPQPNPVIPFLALGGGQPRGGYTWLPFAAGGYALPCAWQIGLEINFPASAHNPARWPVSAAPLVYFWPAAFDPEFPDWGAEFVAYVKGAANIPLN